MEKLIPANKNSQYQIKESEKGFYHMKFVDKIPLADEQKSITEEKFQIFSVVDFKQYLKNKQHFNWESEEIIHDPTLKAAPESEQPVAESDLPVVEKVGKKRFNSKT